ncbi:hypothetical protein [Streptomyces sp. MAR4 CNX-425]|uniref:hypothetical protein n=1 Tax=Streptomyces sp. MAR4 CNX-425 TaxID=3406343 RepID=UPI003B504B44
MRLRSRAPAAAAAAALAALAAFAAARATGAADGPAVATAAEAEPAYAVEDFAYPYADEIQAEKGILLKRGNGHITLADCGPAGLMEVWARARDRVCFEVTGAEGYLSLELPAVYAIKGSDDESATADMTVDGEEKSFDIPAGTWTPVGESTDPEGREHMLVELTTSR